MRETTAAVSSHNEAAPDGLGVPVVDISPWVLRRRQQTVAGGGKQEDRSDDEAGRRAAALQRSAEELGRAFETTGFAVVTGHGLPEHTLREMYRQMVAFFEGPKEVQDAVAGRPVHGSQGFLRPGYENVAQLIGDFSRPHDRVERLSFRNLQGFQAPDGSFSSAWNPALGDDVPIFPPMPEFREALLAYFDALTHIWEALTRASEQALELPEGYMEPFYHPIRGTSLQLAHYLPGGGEGGEESGRPASTAGHAIAQKREAEKDKDHDGIVFGSHTDSGGLSILSTDAPGLEVQLADGEFHKVPMVEGALVVNVGRLLARWTNDRWLAAVHRVRRNQNDARKLTLAHFTSPRADALIETLPTCIGPPRFAPLRYAPIRVSDFMHQRHLLHVPPEQRSEEHKVIPKEFWEAKLPGSDADRQQHSTIPTPTQQEEQRARL